MKKKLPALLLALSLTLLTACGMRQPVESDADLGAFYTDVLEKHELPELMTLEQESIEMLYPGLLDLEQCLVSTAAISSAAGELALAEVKDSKDADAVKEIFQARIDYQTGDGETPGGAFYPETTRQWEENSRIAAKGNYIMLVVAGDPDSIESDFNSLFA
jgi:hypothetical protein